MIIDIDHMSQLSRDDALGIAEKYSYPAIVSVHIGFVDKSKGDKKSEGSLRSSEVNRIYELGGMVAPILWQGHFDQVIRYSMKVPYDCGTSSQAWAQAYLYAKDKMPGRPIRIGSDFNGGIPQCCPRFGSEACFWGRSNIRSPSKVLYPFLSVATNKMMNKSIVGNRAFDINTDGFAHVGMYPDFVADLQVLELSNTDLDPLMKSVKYYVEMWGKAENVFQNTYDAVWQKKPEFPMLIGSSMITKTNMMNNGIREGESFPGNRMLKATK